MTHNAPMHESEGTFSSEESYGMYCGQCRKAATHLAQTWESHCGGFTDFKYTCSVCGLVHWIDGIDS